MAEKFIIDGNFTESFVGTFKLNADACPADFVTRPILHYDISSGNVCYEYDDRICFDYTFGFFPQQQDKTWKTAPSSPNYSPDINDNINVCDCQSIDIKHLLPEPNSINNWEVLLHINESGREYT